MTVLSLGAWNLALAIVTGAFGAHALKARLSPEALDWWSTAVQYHQIHALGLLVVGLLMRPVAGATIPSGLMTSAGLLQLGIVIFSGCLYAMALGAPRWLGAVVPLGGLAFMAGWITLALAAGRWSH